MSFDILEHITDPSDLPQQVEMLLVKPMSFNLILQIWKRNTMNRKKMQLCIILYIDIWQLFYNNP